MLFKGDRWILYTVFFLMLLSTLSVYSSVSALAYQKASGDTTLFLMGHCGKLLVSLVLLCVTSRIKPKYYSGLAELSLIMSIVLLLLTFVVGTNINGSSRWLSIGGLTFQPSELVKISLILYVAKELARNFETPDKAFWRITAVAGITCMVIALENHRDAHDHWSHIAVAHRRSGHGIGCLCVCGRILCSSGGHSV